MRAPVASSNAATAHALDVLARRLARQVAGRAVAFGAAPASADSIEELESIHRAHVARAWVISGAIPEEIGRLFEDRQCMRGHGALVWRRVIGRAERESKAELDRVRRARVRLVSFDEATGQHEGRERAGNVQALQVARATATAEAPVIRRINRADVQRARESLVAFWTFGKSRKWRAALANDRRTLAALVRIARGAGGGVLGDTGAAFNGSSVRKSIERLILRIGHGSALAAVRESANLSCLK